LSNNERLNQGGAEGVENKTFKTAWKITTPQAFRSNTILSISILIHAPAKDYDFILGLLFQGSDSRT